jgi:hypothetical protein
MAYLGFSTGGSVRIVWSTVFVLAACGSVSRPFQDDAASGSDAPSDGSDMEPLPPQLPPTPSREFTAGGGRMKSNTFTLDVQVSHPVGQQPAIGNTYKIEGNAAVKP